MKKLLLYVLLLTVVILNGCSNNKTVTPENVPVGTFSGHFEVIHQKGVYIDSASANINLDLESATGFKVTGDTSTVQEGSFGGFELYNQNGTIYFQDHDTYVTTGAAPKIHLNGLYNYSYDGTTLEIGYVAYQDTLVIKYTLKKD